MPQRLLLTTDALRRPASGVLGALSLTPLLAPLDP